MNRPQLHDRYQITPRSRGAHPGRPASTWTTLQGLDRLGSPRILTSIATDIWKGALSQDALASVRPAP